MIPSAGLPASRSPVRNSVGRGAISATTLTAGALLRAGKLLRASFVGYNLINTRHPDMLPVGMAAGAFRGNAIVYACCAVRMLHFTEARFQWQRALGAKPEAELKPVLERKLRDAHGAATHRWVAHPLYGEIGRIMLGGEPGPEFDGSGIHQPRARA